MLEIRNISRKDVIKNVEHNKPELKGTLCFVKNIENVVFPNLEDLDIKNPVFLISSRTKDNILGVYNDRGNVFYTYIFKFQYRSFT